MRRSDFTDPKRNIAYDEAQAPFWFWNDRLEKKELERQLSLMEEKGIVCTAPHARTGFEGAYLDQEWLEHMKTVIGYKKERGGTMWLYDEFNWPSGIANGEVTKDERFREKYLAIRRFDIPAGMRFRIQPTALRESGLDEKEFLTSEQQGKKIDNLFVYDAGTMERLAVEQFQPEDHSGQLFNLSENDFEILRNRDTIVFEARVQTELFCREGFYDPDYLNADAAKKFTDTVFETYYQAFPEAFGTVITAILDDETRFCHALPWTERLPELFEQRYGYRLEERLPDLILPGEEAGRTRCHYFDLLADLYRENYHGILRSWCEAHGVAYRPHLLGEETLAGQVRYNGEMMRQFREMTKPGVDHLGKGIGSLNIRFASSAAELYGKKELYCEAFAANGWDLTFEEYIRTISWLYSQGVFTITNHAFFYSTRDERRNDWPPSQFFQWKGFERMEEANAMCRRVYGMLKDSVRKTELLIYHPTESFWLHYIPDQNFTHGFHMGPVIQSERAAFIDREEQLLMNRLQEQNRDFTVFSSAAADQFEAVNGKLVNRNTGQEYTAFVLPMCQVLPLESARLLERFSEQGGYLAILEKLPSYGMKREEDLEIQRITDKILKQPHTWYCGKMDVEALIKWLAKAVPQDIRILDGTRELKKSQLYYPDWVIDPYIHTGEDMSGISVTAFEDAVKKYYFVNYSNREEEITVQLDSETEPELWDTFTGVIAPANILQKEKTGNKIRYQIRIRLPKNYGVFLVASK